MFFAILIVFDLFYSSTIEARLLTKTDKLVRSIDNVEEVLDFHYALDQWKKQHVGWDYQIELEILRQKIKRGQLDETLSVRNALKKTIDRSRDRHLQVRFASFESASLPIEIKSIKEDRTSLRRYFISNINRDSISRNKFSFGIGDEIVSWNGRPIVKEVEHLSPLVHTASHPFIDKELTRRYGSWGHVVPQGKVELGIKKKNEERVVEANLSWKYTKELLQPRVLEDDQGNLLLPIPNKSSGLHKEKSFVPFLGQMLSPVDEKSEFYHYDFKSEINKKNYSYVRIQNFKTRRRDKAVASFKGIIEKIEKDSRISAVVIDLNDNSGGRIPYMYALLSLLSDKPMSALKYSYKISGEERIEANAMLLNTYGIETDKDAVQKLGKSFDGYPVSKNFTDLLRKEAEHLLNYWSRGVFLTAPHFSQGVENIVPYPKSLHLTKPILVLVNGLTSSAGEFFASILQDSGRAKIFGERTAGAGGDVRTYKFANYIDIESMRVTRGMIFRPNGQPIENLGVRPSAGFEYDLTSKDLQYGYESYRRAVLNALLIL